MTGNPSAVPPDNSGKLRHWPGRYAQFPGSPGTVALYRQCRRCGSPLLREHGKWVDLARQKTYCPTGKE